MRTAASIKGVMASMKKGKVILYLCLTGLFTIVGWILLVSESQDAGSHPFNFLYSVFASPMLLPGIIFKLSDNRLSEILMFFILFLYYSPFFLPIVFWKKGKGSMIILITFIFLYHFACMVLFYSIPNLD